jgi:hypothetical protein
MSLRTLLDQSLTYLFSYIIQHAHEWYKSPVAIPWDVSLSGYAVRIFVPFLKIYPLSYYKFPGASTNTVKEFGVPIQRN